MLQPENGPQIPVIRWPVPKNSRGEDFSNLEEMLAHLEGESTGHWLIGRNGMWHGGIHITDTTTPWCALSGQAMNEAVDYPVPYSGEQAVCCMADGEVVAYRVNQDYLRAPWEAGDLLYSGSFVLVRHRIQPGKTAESGLTFYTLYMHLAPWLAYPQQENMIPARHNPTRPSWWSALLPPTRETMQLWWSGLLHPSRETMLFDTVVCPTPFPIKAGDPVGHLGYFQVPKNGRHEKRYQMHIECLTPDDLPHFLSNLEGIGRDTPAFARGFDTTEDNPASFDHLDGKTQPKGLVRHIFQTLLNVSSKDRHTSDAPGKHNYQQLLDKVDSDNGEGYSAGEYSRAIHNQDYWMHLYRLCVKHPSHWYYSSEDPVWKAHFSPQLQKEAPEWYAYGVRVLTDTRWMHRVAGMVENPWHLHPLVFLDAIRAQVKPLKGKLTYNAEGNDIPSSMYYSRVVRWSGNILSGVILGRGYYMGDGSERDIYNDMLASGIPHSQAIKIAKGAGLKGSDARDFVLANKSIIGEITLQQQESLFAITYRKHVERTIFNYKKWTSGVPNAKQWETLDTPIQEVLVDFVCQGLTTNPGPMIAGSNNNAQELIDYIKSTAEISQYESSRRRADYLNSSNLY